MFGKVGKICGAAVAATMFVAAPAQAACWEAASVDAAKVRDLETMMMVSALRCRISGHDFLSKYNRFVRESRPALTQANDKLRAHFVSAGTGLNGYDRYVTSLANRYGAGADGLSCRDMSSIVDAAIDDENSFDNLLRLAERADAQPVLNGGLCRGGQIARAR
jgi:hypothetical protein